jgi:hypothetical protein
LGGVFSQSKVEWLCENLGKKLQVPRLRCALSSPTPGISCPTQGSGAPSFALSAKGGDKQNLRGRASGLRAVASHPSQRTRRMGHPILRVGQEIFASIRSPSPFFIGLGGPSARPSRGKPAPVPQPLSRKHRPSLDRSAAERRDLRFSGLLLGASCSATTVPGSTALPSTGAQRSGEICGSAVSSWAPPVQQLLFPGSTALPFVISTGAQRSGEICVTSLESFFERDSRISYPAPLATSTGRFSARSINLKPTTSMRPMQRINLANAGAAHHCRLPVRSQAHFPSGTVSR